MRIIGITGGVGSGKSRVLSYISERYGAVICQADHIAWELEEPGQQGYDDIVTHFGKEILQADGTINRKRLGDIVFADSKQLLVLNRIIHPLVKAEISNRIMIERQKRSSYFILEAALLLEENYQQICDEIWYIYADENTRRLRLKESRNYTEEKITAMMNTQLSDDVFRQKCQIVIDNSGVFEDTCNQIDQAIGEVV